jgi:hypothetical protein
MTPAQIKKRFDTIQKNKKKWDASLTALQELCPHTNAAHKNKANTGNYSSSDDSYWTDHTCPDCGKMWCTDQDWDRK